ncbi:MAG: HTH domain-containing protein, partial [Erysipelotrichaceae bacterium]|nr:HTH domain-containing protein [Erysipelotrichaceae bacterium]
MLLNKRQIQLLRCLLYASTDVSIDALADELSCSTKTVQRDIKIIKEYEEEHHYQLINKKGSVSICCEDSVKDSMFEVLAFLDEIEGQSFVGKRRLDMYLDLLLTSPNPTSIKALSEKYYVSNSSVVNDLSS